MSAAYAYALPRVPAVTAWVTSSAKGINAVPGLGIVVVRRAWAERQARVRAEPGPRGAVWYLDVIEEYASQYEMRRPRFAQSLPLYAALDGACAQWWGTGDGVAEGAVPAPMLAHQARIQRQLTRIVAAVEELYPPILPQMWGAGVVRNLRLPTGRRYEEFAQAMRRRGYFLLCGVPDDDSHVQASTMGSVTDDEVAGLIAALRAEHGGAR
jgi:aspartate aminotransferase-like enzyme